MKDLDLNRIFKEIRKTISPDEKWLDSQTRKFSSKHDGKLTLTISILPFNALAMNRKLMAIIVSGAIVLTGLVGVPVAAQAKDVGPGDFLYPVDLALEDAELALASDEDDVVLLNEQLEERVGESEDSEESGEVSEAIELYNQKVDQLEELLASLCQEGSESCDEDTFSKIETVGFATLRHVEVLAGVFDKQIEKGNESAADAIIGAMEHSLNGHDQAVESLQKSRENSEDGDDGETSVAEEELKAGKDKAKQKIEEAKTRGKGRSK